MANKKITEKDNKKIVFSIIPNKDSFCDTILEIFKPPFAA